MKEFKLMSGWEFHNNAPYAEPLHVAADGRVLRFTLRAGQVVKEHEAPHSPVFVVVLSGHGQFAGADGKETTYGQNSLIIFDAGESHTIRAVKEDLVFVAFLHGAPGYA